MDDALTQLSLGANANQELPATLDASASEAE